MGSLDRFTQAQDARHVGFETAMTELRDGRKRSHWIWYVFPQLAGLGRSAAAQAYGIADVREAGEYLRDPLLRGRLLEAASVVLEQARSGVRLDALMGAEIDVLKLVSSMTLFGGVARRLASADGNNELRQLAGIAEAIVDAAERAGYRRCVYTERQLVGDDFHPAGC